MESQKKYRVWYNSLEVHPKLYVFLNNFLLYKNLDVSSMNKIYSRSFTPQNKISIFWETSHHLPTHPSLGFKGVSLPFVNSCPPPQIWRRSKLLIQLQCTVLCWEKSLSRGFQAHKQSQRSVQYFFWFGLGFCLPGLCAPRRPRATTGRPARRLPVAPIPDPCDPHRCPRHLTPLMPILWRCASNLQGRF